MKRKPAKGKQFETTRADQLHELGHSGSNALGIERWNVEADDRLILED